MEMKPGSRFKLSPLPNVLVRRDSGTPMERPKFLKARYEAYKLSIRRFAMAGFRISQQCVYTLNEGLGRSHRWISREFY